MIRGYARVGRVYNRVAVTLSRDRVQTARRDAGDVTKRFAARRRKARDLL